MSGHTGLPKKTNCDSISCATFPIDTKVGDDAVVHCSACQKDVCAGDEALVESMDDVLTITDKPYVCFNSL
jgi:hypothetical protein